MNYTDLKSTLFMQTHLSVQAKNSQSTTRKSRLSVYALNAQHQSSQDTFLTQSVNNISTIYSQFCTKQLRLTHTKKLPLSLLVFLGFLITSMITQTPHTSPRLLRPTSPAYKCCTAGDGPSPYAYHQVEVSIYNIRRYRSRFHQRNMWTILIYQQSTTMTHADGT